MRYCDFFMELKLARMPVEKVRSRYRRDRSAGFPVRLGFLHPEALVAFVAMQEACGWLIVLSDGWRAAIVSLEKKYPPGKPANKYSQFPAHSGHNFGYSIDVDVPATLRLTGWSKRELDDFMASFGFYCHRRDHKRGKEEWHYNALFIGAVDWMRYATATRTSQALERMVVGTYGDTWRVTQKQAQRGLKLLGLYPGEIDGKWGNWSKVAARSFQRAWHLKEDGVIGVKSGRVLQLRCAELRNPLVQDLWTVKG